MKFQTETDFYFANKKETHVSKNSTIRYNSKHFQSDCKSLTYTSTVLNNNQNLKYRTQSISDIYHQWKGYI